jgi:hypothetical protein
MCLVPDQHAVEQLVAAGLDPPFHDRIHSRHADAAEHGLDPGVGEDGVEQGGVFAVPVADEVLDWAAGVFDIHDQVAGGLRHPGCGRRRGSAEDAYAAGGVLDDGQDVQSDSGERDGFEEVGGDDGLGL